MELFQEQLLEESSVCYTPIEDDMLCQSPNDRTGGPRNILPAALIFSLLGVGGQLAVNKRASSHDAAPQDESGSWLNFKWSPMKKLTDAEYEHILSEKLLELEAEIAIVDDNIAELKAQKEQQKASLASRPSTGESTKP